MTEALNSAKDSASAEKAASKLKEIEKKLDDTKTAVDKLPAASKSTLGSLVKVALGKLREVVDKVLATAGVGDTITPVVDAIMTKLNTFVA